MEGEGVESAREAGVEGGVIRGGGGGGGGGSEGLPGQGPLAASSAAHSCARRRRQLVAW